MDLRADLLERAATLRTLDGFDGHTPDDVIIGLVQRFPRTKCIDLHGCRNLTDAAIIAVADKCPELGSLNVEGCLNLTDAAIDTLKQRLPGVEVRRPDPAKRTSVPGFVQGG